MSDQPTSNQQWPPSSTGTVSPDSLVPVLSVPNPEAACFITGISTATPHCISLYEYQNHVSGVNPLEQELMPFVTAVSSSISSPTSHYSQPLSGIVGTELLVQSSDDVPSYETIATSLQNDPLEMIPTPSQLAGYELQNTVTSNTTTAIDDELLSLIDSFATVCTIDNRPQEQLYYNSPQQYIASSYTATTTESSQYQLNHPALPEQAHLPPPPSTGIPSSTSIMDITPVRLPCAYLEHARHSGSSYSNATILSQPFSHQANERLYHQQIQPYPSYTTGTVHGFSTYVNQPQYAMSTGTGLPLSHTPLQHVPAGSMMPLTHFSDNSQYLSLQPYHQTSGGVPVPAVNVPAVPPANERPPRGVLVGATNRGGPLMHPRTVPHQITICPIHGPVSYDASLVYWTVPQGLTHPTVVNRATDHRSSTQPHQAKSSSVTSISTATSTVVTTSSIPSSIPATRSSDSVSSPTADCIIVSSSVNSSSETDIQNSSSTEPQSTATSDIGTDIDVNTPSSTASTTLSSVTPAASDTDASNETSKSKKAPCWPHPPTPPSIAPGSSKTLQPEEEDTVSKDNDPMAKMVEFAENFRLKRLELDFSPTGVAQQVNIRFGSMVNPPINGLMVCMFEEGKLELDNMIRMKNYLENWLVDTERARGVPLERAKELAQLATTKKDRKKRAFIDEYHRYKLEQEFKKNNRPTRSQMREIAATIGDTILDYDTVRIWFCNRRNKQKMEMEAAEIIDSEDEYT